MHRDKTGNGGLSFGPPPAGDSPPAEIGFAPDIEEMATHAAGLPAFSAAQPTSQDETGRMRRVVEYPLAEACLRRLLGEAAEYAFVKNATSDIAPFAIGPAVMRPPPELTRPPEQKLETMEPGAAAPKSHTDALLEDMVDVLLVGEDGGRPEVHLSFKPEVFGGLYLRLERRSEGLFAHFSVPDDHARRAVQGHIDDLLARLSAAGFAICGSSLHVQDTP